MGPIAWLKKIFKNDGDCCQLQESISALKHVEASLDTLIAENERLQGLIDQAIAKEAAPGPASVPVMETETETLREQLKKALANSIEAQEHLMVSENENLELREKVKFLERELERTQALVPSGEPADGDGD